VAELKGIPEEGAHETAAGNFLPPLGFLFLTGLLLAALSKDQKLIQQKLPPNEKV